jgi:hypothetical protein
MEKKNKYCYGWAILCDYGNGWEKVSVYDKSYDTYAQVKKDAAEYAFTGVPTKITGTRWLNN